MIIKILPAGDLFPYLNGRFDSMGNEREVAAELLHEIRAFPDDQDSIATRLLQAQAPAGLRSRLKGAEELSVPSGLRKRRNADWIRHNQAHLVHLINCFHERRDLVEPHLRAVVRATEDLLLAGLPREALHFTWYKHDQKIAPHTHGGLMRILLPDGKPYEPKLDSRLCLAFNRLVSLYYQWRDPLDPEAIRLVQAGPGSWKTANKRLIRKVCQTATRKWEGDKLFGYDQFIGHLKQRRFGLTILAQPDGQGKQILHEPMAAGLRVPNYKNTVVVLRRQKPGNKPQIILFSGPMCHPNFASRRQEYEQRRASRNVAVRALQSTDPTAAIDLYEKFTGLLEERYARQYNLFDGPNADRVSRVDFDDWLNPASVNWKAQMARHTEAAKIGEEQAEGIDLFSSDSDWGGEYYPFVSNVTPEITDITDPLRSPLREAIEEQNWALQVEEDDCEVPEVTVSAAALATVVVQTPATEQKPPESAPSPTTGHAIEVPVASPVKPGPTLPETHEIDKIGIPAMGGIPAEPQPSVESGGNADSPSLPDAPTPNLNPAKESEPPTAFEPAIAAAPAEEPKSTIPPQCAPGVNEQVITLPSSDFANPEISDERPGENDFREPSLPKQEEIPVNEHQIANANPLVEHFIKTFMTSEASTALAGNEEMASDTTESGSTTTSPKQPSVSDSSEPHKQKDTEKHSKPIQVIPAPLRVPIKCWHLLLAEELTEAERRRKRQLLISLKVAADAQAALQMEIAQTESKLSQTENMTGPDQLPPENCLPVTMGKIELTTMQSPVENTNIIS